MLGLAGTASQNKLATVPLSQEPLGGAATTAYAACCGSTSQTLSDLLADPQIYLDPTYTPPTLSDPATATITEREAGPLSATQSDACIPETCSSTKDSTVEAVSQEYEEKVNELFTREGSNDAAMGGYENPGRMLTNECLDSQDNQAL